MHTFSRTQNNPLLRRPDARERSLGERRVRRAPGLRNGAIREARNQDGVSATAMRVKATQRIRADCVYMVYGFGHTTAAEARLSAGASAARLTTRTSSTR